MGLFSRLWGSSELPIDDSQQFLKFKAALAVVVGMGSPNATTIAKIDRYFAAMRTDAPGQYKVTVEDINARRNEELHIQKALVALLK